MDKLLSNFERLQSDQEYTSLDEHLQLHNAKRACMILEPIITFKPCDSISKRYRGDEEVRAHIYAGAWKDDFIKRWEEEDKKVFHNRELPVGSMPVSVFTYYMQFKIFPALKEEIEAYKKKLKTINNDYYLALRKKYPHLDGRKQGKQVKKQGKPATSSACATPTNEIFKKPLGDMWEVVSHDVLSDEFTCDSPNAFPWTNVNTWSCGEVDKMYNFFSKHKSKVEVYADNILKQIKYLSNSNTLRGHLLSDINTYLVNDSL